MSTTIEQFEQRKQDHIELALKAQHQTMHLNALDAISLPHEALPDLDFNDISLTSTRFKQTVAKPFFVSSMTAGHKHAARINSHLLEACHHMHWAMGVGSQRRELFDKEAMDEWRTMRARFPNVALFSNLGIAQAITCSLSQLQALVDSIKAQALIIHCNPLQEVIQPEGTPFFKGCWQALERIVQTLKLPVIVKETGCGFSQATLQRLNDIGIAAVDVSGLGGTHWGRIEGARRVPDSPGFHAAHTFKDWGVTTVDSIKQAIALKPNFEIWGSGGVRHGLDAAKLLALGATQIGLAKHMLKAAKVNASAVQQAMMLIEYELKIALFCTGSSAPAMLKGKLC